MGPDRFLEAAEIRKGLVGMRQQYRQNVFELVEFGYIGALRPLQLGVSGEIPIRSGSSRAQNLEFI